MVMDGYHSQDRLSKLREKISEQHLNYLMSGEVPAKNASRLKLLVAVRDYLLIAPPNHKYLLPETSATLHQSAQLPTFTANKASKGWDAIAKYAANLISQPWRKEYKQINTYSGYYKHHVEANLDTVAEQMFRAMGYRAEEGGVLVLDGPVCPDQVTCVSLDAIFANVECQILNEIFDEIYQTTSIKATWSEILDFRDTHDCSPMETARSLIYLSGANQQQLTYSNTTHTLPQLTETDSSGGYYNNTAVLPYGSSATSKKLLNGSSLNGVGDRDTQLRYDGQMEYGNIGGHAGIPAAYSFPPLRHHTQPPPQYYLPSFDNMDCYNRYSQCGGNGMIIPMHPPYYPDQHHYQGAMMYHPMLKQQPPPCCVGGNGYIVPDMSVPSTAAITPAHHPTSCLCNHPPTSMSSMVPTAQLIDFDNTSHHQQHPQIGHDVPDGLTTTPRMRNNHHHQNQYQPQQRAYSNGNHHSARRDRDNALVEDVSGCSVEHRRGVGADKGGVKGERELRLEEGSGTYESWDYVYKNLESQGYSKDLGERGDILVSDRSGKRRTAPTTTSKAAELPEKLNGLTISEKPHKSSNQTPYERRNSDETQSSYYDNVPTSKTLRTVAGSSNATKTPQGHSISTLMQQKMKSNRLSEVKAKVDSRRTSVSKVDGGMVKGTSVRESSSNWENREGTGKQSGAMSNGMGKRQTGKQSPPQDLNTIEDITSVASTSYHRPLLTHKDPPTVTSPTTSTSATTWECSSCTYLNTKDSNICEMCAKTRDVALLDTSMEIGGPQCLSCTLVNPKGAAVCQACEHTLNNSPTYI